MMKMSKAKIDLLFTYTITKKNNRVTKGVHIVLPPLPYNCFLPQQSNVCIYKAVGVGGYEKLMNKSNYFT